MRSKWCKECGVLHDADAWPHAGGQSALRADLAQVFVSDVLPEKQVKGGRYVSCRCCGGIHNLRAWPHNCPWPYQVDEARSELPSPQVVRDGLPDIMHPLTGKPVDSKRKLRRDYRAAGVEEIGNDKSHVRRERYVADEKDIAKDVKKAMEQLKSDNVSNDEMANMLRSAPPSAMGMQCGVGFETPSE